MKNILLLFSILISTIAFAQPPAVVKADAAFKSGKYYEAADLSVKAYERISPKNERALDLKSSLAYKAGYSFEKAFDNDKAIEWYQRAIDLRHYEENPYVYFRLGSAYKLKGEYDKARVNYQEFLKLVPMDKQAENALASLEDAVVMKDNRTRYTVKSETKINDAGMDMAPAIANRRGNAIVFGSTRSAVTGKGKDPITGEGYFNIWEAEKERGGNWTAPKLFEADSLNTEHNEGTLVFDGRFRNIYFTRCPSIHKQDLGCQIWTAEKKGRSFGLPEKLPLSPNDTISVGHPLPNEDGSALIFSSDMEGGFGGRDLWYSEYDRRGKSWSKPVNLGPEINTAGDELFPTFALNGDLLFSSTGHKGLGGLDIFRATKTDDPKKFEKPKNLGTPLNSDANDYHLTEVEKRSGFFTSNRKGSVGTKNLPDIWSYELPPNLFDLKVIITEVGGVSRIEGATVEITPEGGQPFTKVTNANGEVFWDKKPDGDRYINEETDFVVKVLPTEGFHPSDNIEVFSTKDLEYDQNFILEMNLLPKTPIVLPEVRYDLGSAVLQIIEGEINSKDSLNYVYELLQEYPGMVLKLVSHTDARGSAKANENLAKKRAESCVDYLVNEKGVNPARLIATGKGENSPRIIYLKDEKYTPIKPAGEFEAIELTEAFINKFKTSDKELFEQLHQYNRRTEAEVVRMDYKPASTEVKTDEKLEEETEKVEEK
ncbi:MAG TPA: OmpA family protein [Brumimicrobium sp.]|nr:OmpA family protein [Brumimicrobium sp.]